MGYARAQREANAALAAWRTWHQGAPAYLIKAANATTEAAPVPDTPQEPPSPRLRVVRWLYEQGRLSG